MNLIKNHLINLEKGQTNIDIMIDEYKTRLWSIKDSIHNITIMRGVKATEREKVKDENSTMFWEILAKLNKNSTNSNLDQGAIETFSLSGAYN